MTGVLPVDKPEGPTSHDIVAAARRALRQRRIGHTGTLDPFASGLLLLCIGTATRIAEYLSGLDKAYEATARLGARTDTLDGTGAVLATSEGWRDLDDAAVRSAFEDLRGAQLQEPPAFSAKRVGGRRAYDLARKGVDVRPDPVEVTVHTLEVTDVAGDVVRFRVRCSSGTYIRALARDAGEALGVGAHLTALRRTAIGEFHVRDALAVDALEDAADVARALVPPLAALSHLPAILLDPDAVGDVRHGRTLPAEPGTPAGTVALAADGDLVAIAEADGTMIRPRKVFT